MKFHSDCRFYVGNKPCTFHKKDGRECGNCSDYSPFRTRILIVKLDAIGDVLRTTSVLPALAEKYPSSEITWITRRNALPVLENNPWIHNNVALENNNLLFLFTEKFDIGICLDPDHASATILAATTCRTRLGFTTSEAGKVTPASHSALEWYHMGLHDSLKRRNRKTYQQIIYEICGLTGIVHKPQFIVDPVSASFAEHFRITNHLNDYSKIIGINTGGGSRWQYKKWIRENYPVLIKRIKKMHPDAGILLMGGPEEVAFNEFILANAGEKVIDCGCDNSIARFAALISLTDIFLTPDSLGMHIAVALNKVTLATVGPTSPWELSVYDKGEVIFNNQLDCISCYKSRCDFAINCMNTLEPEFIYARIRQYL